VGWGDARHDQTQPLTNRANKQQLAAAAAAAAPQVKFLHCFLILTELSVNGYLRCSSSAEAAPLLLTAVTHS
jgi:hypothetical protein